MAATLSIIGLDLHEAASVRRLVALLRSPDPVIGELARQAIRHVEDLNQQSFHAENPSAPETLPTQRLPVPDWSPGATRRGETA
jgi:hypothetical protein